MKKRNVLRMNAEDTFIFMVLMSFMTTPLLLILLAGSMRMVAVV